jgi:hypothetical protein
MKFIERWEFYHAGFSPSTKLDYLPHVIFPAENSNLSKCHVTQSKLPSSECRMYDKKKGEKLQKQQEKWEKADQGISCLIA